MSTDKAAILGVTFAVLLVASRLLHPLEELAGGGSVRSQLRAEQLAGVAGHGGSLALLGGMRAMAANVAWLQANLAWERRDAAATTALIELTVAADERPPCFWLNGARILACDLQDWRLPAYAPAALRARVNEDQAQQALRLLEKGVRWHGPDPSLYVEMANIHLRRRGDLESAAQFYRLAAEQPAAPYYAARIHAELLRELGRKREALEWLRRVLPALPPGDPQARREVVVARIEALESEVVAQPR